MSASKSMYIRNTAYIPSNCKDIRITDIKELYAIALKSHIGGKKDEES